MYYKRIYRFKNNENYDIIIQLNITKLRFDIMSMIKKFNNLFVSEEDFEDDVKGRTNNSKRTTKTKNFKGEFSE
ncbi:hypothetical protein HMPREF1983_00309 [Gemella bergeri ATCC 700627]|uniref:Uncharacterized protein n=1 Tax=Gemella bergeri ATCC 700627 TaxID=1321820 RepID=U2S3B1_9BACL|nr:hypothetical protein HMPREF1983_00309 [Gemella bergeri ATCC 700627]